MRIGDETVITMATIEAMADGIVQKAKECNNFLQFSEGLVRRDIDLVRMQFEIKLKKLHNRALAELQDLVTMERESLQERVGEAANILKRIKKTDKDKLDEYLLDESRMDLEDLQEGIHRKRIKFFVNEQFSELFNSMETFGECSVQPLKFAQDAENGDTFDHEAVKQSETNFQGTINKDKTNISNINGVGGVDVNGLCSSKQSLEGVDPFTVLRSLSQSNKKQNAAPIVNSVNKEKGEHRDNDKIGHHERVVNSSGAHTNIAHKAHLAKNGSTKREVDKDSKHNITASKHSDTSSDSQRQSRSVAKTQDRTTNRNQNDPKRHENKESVGIAGKSHPSKTDNNLSTSVNSNPGKSNMDSTGESPRQNRHERVAQANKIWFGSRIPVPVAEQKPNKRRSRSLSPKSARKTMENNTVDIAIEKAANGSVVSGKNIDEDNAVALSKYNVTSNDGNYRRKISSTDESSESSEASRDDEVGEGSDSKGRPGNSGKTGESPRESTRKERQVLKRNRNRTLAGDIASLLKEINENKVAAADANNTINGCEKKSHELENGVVGENDTHAQRFDALSQVDVDNQRDMKNVASRDRPPLIGRDRKVRTLNLHGGTSVRRGLHSVGNILQDPTSSDHSRNGSSDKNKSDKGGTSKNQNIGFFTENEANQEKEFEVTSRDTKLSKLYDNNEHRLRLPSLDDMLYTE